MKTVILCGGRGTRIRDVSSDVPKPMIPIGGRPILWHIMKGYAAAGHVNFILCTGYKSEIIKEFFLDYEAFTNDFTITLGAKKSIEYHKHHEELEWRVTLVDTGLDTMTGSRVSQIRQHIGDDESFMLTYGDGVSDVDINSLIAFHEGHKKVATVTGVRPPGRFGEIDATNNGNVREFNEKPQAKGGRVSGGFFVFRREIFDYLDDRRELVLEEEPMRTLVDDNQLMLFEHNGFWQCMDTFRDYRLLDDLWVREAAPWKVW